MPSTLTPPIHDQDVAASSAPPREASSPAPPGSLSFSAWFLAHVEFQLGNLLAERLQDSPADDPLTLKEIDGMMRTFKSFLDIRLKLARLEQPAAASRAAAASRSSASAEIAAINSLLKDMLRDASPPRNSPQQQKAHDSDSKNPSSNPDTAASSSPPQPPHAIPSDSQSQPHAPGDAAPSMDAAPPDGDSKAPPTLPATPRENTSPANPPPSSSSSPSSSSTSRFQLADAGMRRFMKDRNQQNAQRARADALRSARDGGRNPVVAGP